MRRSAATESKIGVVSATWDGRQFGDCGSNVKVAEKKKGKRKGRGGDGLVLETVR